MAESTINFIFTVYYPTFKTVFMFLVEEKYVKNLSAALPDDEHRCTHIHT